MGKRKFKNQFFFSWLQIFSNFYLQDPVCGIDFQKELQLYMFDLMSLSLCKFNRQNLDNLSQISSFSCYCVKESWLLIQLLIENLSLSNKQISFWDIFNKTLMSVQQDKSITKIKIIISLN